MPVERSTLHRRTCFLLIFPKWLTYQAKDLNIREWNNRVLGKFTIKKGGQFSRGRPFKTKWKIKSFIKNPEEKNGTILELPFVELKMVKTCEKRYQHDFSVFENVMSTTNNLFKKSIEQMKEETKCSLTFLPDIWCRSPKILVDWAEQRKQEREGSRLEFDIWNMINFDCQLFEQSLCTDRVFWNLWVFLPIIFGILPALLWKVQYKIEFRNVVGEQN